MNLDRVRSLARAYEAAIRQKATDNSDLGSEALAAILAGSRCLHHPPDQVVALIRAAYHDAVDPVERTR